MGRMGIAVVLVVALCGGAEARGRRGGGRSKAARYDPSLDFSKHFDEEVKQEREHPRTEDGTPAPAPRHRRSHTPAPNEGGTR